ncbi:MAG: transcriptional repressor [Planctomycetota bacterium]|nr:transcriptional repressor [Planctomycetota bacterium]
MRPAKKRRSTVQRRVILEELEKSENHPTASELYEIVRQRLSDISLGTVYRNLVLLSDLGIIQKLEFCGSETRFDGRCEDHYHIQCVDCGRVNDLHGLPGDLSIKLPTEDNDFLITGHRLVFYGICGKCQQKGD